jgi:D-alanine transaminase
MSEVYLNGQFMDISQAAISPLDRGFLFADGAYEVIPVFNGVLFRVEEHLRRLERSLKELQINTPHSRSAWKALCEDIVTRNGGGDQSVYLQVTRGAPSKRDHGFPAADVPPTIFLVSSPLGRSEIHGIDKARGAGAITTDDTRWARCDIKSVSLLPNILARQQAISRGAVEAILIRDGRITEGSSTNVFIVDKGNILTPPLSNGILGGITRELVIELCRHHGMSIDERNISLAQLQQADEVWITSSTKDVLAIVSLDDQTIGNGKPGPVWKQVASNFLAYKQATCG